MYAFNKIDLINDKNIFIKINKTYNKPIMISAYKNLKMEELYNKIDEIFIDSNNTYTIHLPHKDNI